MRFVSFSICMTIILILFIPFSGWSIIATTPSGLTITHREHGELSFFLGTTIDIENGDMTYAIYGNESGGWKSELEWQLDSILYIGEIMSIGVYDNILLNAGFWKAVTDDAGSMIDKDWIYAYYGSDPFIYSKSDATVDGLHVDMNVRYDFLRLERGILGALLGFSYSKWDWEAGNGYQTSVDPNFNVGEIEGIGITYEETVKVPYVGLIATITPVPSSLFTVDLYGVYSTLAQCDDEDDHLLRYKLNTGESDGTFLSLGADIRWTFHDSWSLTGKLRHAMYDLDGEQTQLFYADNPYNSEAPPAGTRYENINLTVDGSQTYLGLMVGYEF